MAIHVMLEGELPPVWLPCVPSDSVEEALNDAADLWEKDLAGVRLLFNGEELSDREKTLSDYGVTIDDLLVLTERR